MKYRALGLLTVIALGLALWAAYQTGGATEETPITQLMPQGAVLFLEARDFSALLRDWNASPEKQAWLTSDNYAQFSRSRLLLRLAQVQKEFAAAAGVPPDTGFMREVAGGHSALGIYDIGKLELLYITRLPSARSVQSGLWQKRAQFTPRQAAGREFFVRTDADSGRVVAFAVAGDYLVLGTREDLVAGAVSLLAGQKLATLSQESWFVNALKLSKEPGEVRMLIHLAAVTKTPQFRTYWVQQNITDMQAYESSVSDLFRGPNGYREERVLLRNEAPEADLAEGARAAADLLRLAPPEAGFYRVEAAPSAEYVLATVEEKVLTPRLGPAPPDKSAPTVQLGDGAVGSESNLEVRIDAPPATPATEAKGDALLKSVLAKGNARAVLALHRSETATDGVFVGLRSTVVLAGGENWDEAAVRAAVQQLLAPALTAGRLGVGWKNSGTGPQAYAELDGIVPVSIAARGKYLVVSNDPELTSVLLARLREPAAGEGVVYAAGFNHARERQNFYRLSGLVDRPNRVNAENTGSQPQFFSQNLASLSQVFAGVKAQSIEIRRTGNTETQTVRYEWSR